MYRLVDIPPPGGFFWSQTVGVVPSLRGPSTFRRLHTFYVRPPQKKGSPCTPRSDRRMGLIIPWSQVRVLAGPPSPIEFMSLWRRERGIGVPWCIRWRGRAARVGREVHSFQIARHQPVLTLYAAPSISISTLRSTRHWMAYLCHFMTPERLAAQWNQMWNLRT